MKYITHFIGHRAEGAPAYPEPTMLVLHKNSILPCTFQSHNYIRCCPVQMCINNLFLIKPTRRTNFPNFILSKKTLHVSGTSFAHHQEFSTYIRHWYISCRFDDSFQAGSGWSSILTLLGSCHQIRSIPMSNVGRKLLMMGKGSARNM